MIDTNVCLDLFIYRDPASLPLMHALQKGHVAGITRTDCRDEWLRVLRYPQIETDEVQYREACAAYDTWLRPLSPSAAEPTMAAANLPRCSDPDDQKFLELALESGASALITKDKALLKLNRKTHKLGMFLILTPLDWCEVQV
ncbi:MAG TPA: putative toxin-antitoxin system toxin component, PIN family [Rhodanobacteraceae bacterium]|nr:putative toxin-antitoxin system toxin component, PIN family [Rhodanobacteraceae bacterium]